ncbi:hypothetical protein PQR15_22270 [Streptomyces lydicus]|nr:hypothetical protein [Streptomyces lydicus]
MGGPGAPGGGAQVAAGKGVEGRRAVPEQCVGAGVDEVQPGAALGDQPGPVGEAGRLAEDGERAGRVGGVPWRASVGGV